MNPNELKRLFPNASKSVVAANAQGSLFPDGCKRESENAAMCAKPKRDLSDGALGKSKKKRADTGRVLVRVTSVRKRLLDEDNRFTKYIVDCCRYSGLILGDAPGQTKIEAEQRKPEKGEEEHTLIEIYQLEN